MRSTLSAATRSRSASRPSSTSASSIRGRRRARRSSRGGSRPPDFRADARLARPRSKTRRSSGDVEVAQVGPGVDVAVLAPSAGTSTRSSGASTVQRQAVLLLVVGRTGVQPGRRRRTSASCRRPSGRRAPRRRGRPRRRGAAGRSCAVRNGMSQASTASHGAVLEQRVAAGEQRRDRAAVPRVLAGEGHRPVGRHLVADDDHLGRVDHGVERPGEQRAAVGARPTPCRRRRAGPRCRRRATTAVNCPGSSCLESRSTSRGRRTRWTGTLGDVSMLSVTWSRRRPASTRPTTGPAARAGRPRTATWWSSRRRSPATSARPAPT